MHIYEKLNSHNLYPFEKTFQMKKMKEAWMMKKKNRTATGTDIDEVKRLNSKSGLSYNEAKVALANKNNSRSTR